MIVDYGEIERVREREDKKNHAITSGSVCISFSLYALQAKKDNKKNGKRNQFDRWARTIDFYSYCIVFNKQQRQTIQVENC